MAFNTKISLDNNKVIQSNGAILSLSGHTIIANDGDLKYQTHPTFSGDTQVVDKKYVDDNIIIATGSTIYNLESPSAVLLCGITIGYVLTGKSTNCILQDLLVPELFQTSVGSPSTSVGLSQTGTFEIGCSLSQTITPTYTAGAVTPPYCSTAPYTRGGAANGYSFTGPSVSGGFSGCTSCALTPYIVTANANTWSVCTRYNAGSTIKGSKGTLTVGYQPALTSGCTAAGSATITGILPYFYGYSVGVPTPDSALLTTGTKVVATSTGQINITYGIQTGKYFWFATPNASTTKLGWYEGPTNKGNIGLISDLFYAPTGVTVNSPSACWSGEVYKIYISNYTTDTSANAYCMTNIAQQ